MLGHAKLETTSIYTRVSPKLIAEATSPFDSLPDIVAQTGMTRPSYEVADIVRSLGPGLRAGKSRNQHRVLNAIEACRTAKLGGHITRCGDCGVLDASYNSCRNRHCPFKAVSQTLLTIGADPKHLGAKLGATLVLHTWGSAMMHHPHIHGIVPGGGLSPDGARWVDCRANFFLPVRVLSSLFRRLMCEGLAKLHAEGALKFFGHNKHLADARTFAECLQRERRRDWVVYAKQPFTGPEQVLAYLARYTHRIAISNSRITAFDGSRVTFKIKDYRKQGQARYTTMTLDAAEFMRRFLIHVLPSRFHRIRHIGFLANTNRAKAVDKIRTLLADRIPDQDKDHDGNNKEPEDAPPNGPAPCAHCGGKTILVEIIPRPTRLRPQANAPPIKTEERT